MKSNHLAIIGLGLLALVQPAAAQSEKENETDADGDWADGGLSALCKRTGLPDPQGVLKSGGAEAGVIAW
jgi:hypothetical protein